MKEINGLLVTDELDGIITTKTGFIDNIIINAIANKKNNINNFCFIYTLPYFKFALKKFSILSKGITPKLSYKSV